MSDPKKTNSPEQEPEISEEVEPVEAELEPEEETAEEPAETEPESEMDVLVRERDDYKDRWMRSVADQENLRRRTRREVTEARIFASAEMIRPLLEVLDDFERADASLKAENQEQDSESSALESYSHGVGLVHDRLRGVLSRKGVVRIEVTPGDVFDPELHEAVAQLASEDIESGAIIDVVQAGYRFEERVLRAARVVVAQ